MWCQQPRDNWTRNVWFPVSGLVNFKGPSVSHSASDYGDFTQIIALYKLYTVSSTTTTTTAVVYVVVQLHVHTGVLCLKAATNMQRLRHSLSVFELFVEVWKLSCTDAVVACCVLTLSASLPWTHQLLWPSLTVQLNRTRIKPNWQLVCHCCETITLHLLADGFHCHRPH